MSSSTPIVVGVIFPAKKIARLQEVLDEEDSDVRFVLIDLEAVTPTGDFDSEADVEAAAERFAAQYGPLNALLHKLAHDMVFAKLGDKKASNRMRLVQHYLQRHPSLRVVDPIDSVRLLTDRYAACMMLQNMEHKNSGKIQRFRVPKFHKVDNFERYERLLKEVDAGLTRLPLICKSVEACATDRSHMMSVIAKREDLRYVEFPTLYQEFINHSNRLFKGYVIGDTINVAERRSLPNIVAGSAQQVHFNTQQDYPTELDFQSHVDESAQTNINDGMTQQEIFEAVQAIGSELRDELELTLFGFDVIVAEGSMGFYVIDVNYFPSYQELNDFGGMLRKHIKQLCCRR
ncbi:inositol-tetrakisphosphate 1-kinase-like [Plasmopara halstedii]|uniref:Inositol-tetrakisphosphate 1-kinase n=1 Tax=Plasmopara halstedii TaxID=4781 RepID=A0A0N7L8H5_PLAHL|nr:inositol-tetrakisphosphate 1-kinase-like [Plasmopara halstedii]CEG49891.1 inositol-tetrakisphosphate 1-kinase-like [Plasmopara halstedii]|eukprot:XP_024586260.1 inositol-tetrakisphosphate 1-kinase-like [Plasmopara halstedii]